MRATVHIDDDLMATLRSRAQGEGLSITRILDHVLRAGLDALSRSEDKREIYRETTFPMGSPHAGLDKSLALAAALEDDEVLRNMSLRK